MKRKIIVTSISGVIFLISLIFTFIYNYESLDVVSSITGTTFGLILIYCSVCYLAYLQIITFEKKINKELLSKNIEELDDIDRYVYIAYSYINNFDKEYTKEEQTKINSTFLIIGGHHIYKDINKIGELKLRVINFYKKKKENRFKSNFFFDKNDFFLGWGFSLLLGVIGSGLIIYADIVFNKTGDMQHMIGWLLSLIGGACVIPLAGKICLALGLK